MGPLHISPLQDLRLIALCGRSEEQTMQFGFWALTNPDKASVCVFLRFELQASPLFSFQFPRISAVCYTEKLGQNVCMWGTFRETRSETGREGGRESMCVTQVTFDNLVWFFITDTTERLIKKLYSNWYDQAEHWSQISNIKIRQLTRLENKARLFSPILCLIG